MRTRQSWLKLAAVWWLASATVALASAARAEAASGDRDAAAIQAIQQASDPSAAIWAFANGTAEDHHDPKLLSAFISRMVDWGLPEMAYHQAETLTTLQTNDGLAWGVVAYVDARQGRMPEAVSAINLAGRFAPSNAFVARTAGELLAWYDLRADKGTLPGEAKRGLDRIRGLLAKQAAFTSAYDAARQAYEGQGKAAQAGPAQAAPQYAPMPQAGLPAPPPQADVEGGAAAPDTYAPPPPVSPDYADYPDPYYDYAPDDWYDWGPGWIGPAPWCWWAPCGFWGGCGFLPFGAACLFGDFGHGFGHHGGWDGWHDHGFGHGGFAGGFGPGGGPAAWHNGEGGGHGFFGAPARPDISLARAEGASRGPGTVTTLRGEGGPAVVAREGSGGRGEFHSGYASPHVSGGGTFTYRAMPAYHAPAYSASHWAAPAGTSFGRYNHNYSGGHYGGSSRGGSSGGSHGGGGFGGGFHGGGFGGDHGGGGHR